MKRRFLWLRIESYRAKMLLDDSLHGIQPQPQSLTEGFCGKEGLEHAIRILRRNSVPGIGDLDKNRLPLQLVDRVSVPESPIASSEFSISAAQAWFSSLPKAWSNGTSGL